MKNNKQTISFILWLIGGVALGIIVTSFFNAKQVQAQVLSGKVSTGCYQSASARHACFMKGFEGRLEGAKTDAAQRKSIREAKLALQPNFKEEGRVKREKALQALRKQAEASKSRNTSHAGQRYVITYGRVAEPR